MAEHQAEQVGREGNGGARPATTPERSAQDVQKSRRKP